MYEWIELRGLLLAFLQNIALFIILSFMLGRLSDRYKLQGGTGWHALATLIFSAGAIISMQMPYQPVPGVLLDQRNMILLFAGPFGGLWAAVIAGASTAVARVYMGGIGADAGAAAAISSALLGIVFMKFMGRLQTIQSAMTGAILLGLVNYPWVVLLRESNVGVDLTESFAIPYLVLYLMGAPALSMILMVHRRRLIQEQELFLAKQKLEDILDVSTDWFWEIDEELRFTYLSPSFRRIFDDDPANYLGKRRSEIAAESQKESACRFEQLLWQKEPFAHVRYSFAKDSGEVRYVSISGKPLFGLDGTFQGYRGSGRDVTVEVRAEKGLRNALSEAEAGNRAKSEFLSHMSHELRTPLNAIIGFADMMRMQIRGDLGNAEYREDAASIHGAGHHLLSLINDLLDLSRLDAGKNELDLAECHPASIVTSATVMLRQSADNSGISLQVRNELEVTAWLEERAFKQVVINLISNAIKFTKPGGIVRVELDQASDGTLVLLVSDTGTGISLDEIENVLRPFERARGARESAAEGTGLGLPISKALVEAHGGTLTIQSEQGVGTRVEVRIPEASGAAAGLRSADKVA
jgi:PAS domain S-box-containing protein